MKMNIVTNVTNVTAFFNSWLYFENTKNSGVFIYFLLLCYKIIYIYSNQLIRV